jgi:hypothetical protein
MSLFLERNPSREGREGAPWAPSPGQPGFGFWARLGRPHPSRRRPPLPLGHRPCGLGKGQGCTPSPLYKEGAPGEESTTQLHEPLLPWPPPYTSTWLPATSTSLS